MIWKKDDDFYFEFSFWGLMWVIAIIVVYAIYAFVCGASGGLMSIMVVGAWLEKRGISIGTTITEGSTPILYAALAAFVICFIFTRFSYQAHLAGNIYFFSGLSVFILQTARFSNVLVAHIVAAVLSIILAVVFTFVLAEIIPVFGIPIAKYNFTKKSVLAGGIVGFIPVALAMSLSTLSMLVSYTYSHYERLYIELGEPEGMFEEMEQMAYSSAGNSIIVAIVVGIVSACVSLAVSIIIHNKQK